MAVQPSRLRLRALQGGEGPSVGSFNDALLGVLPPGVTSDAIETEKKGDTFHTKITADIGPSGQAIEDTVNRPDFTANMAGQMGVSESQVSMPIAPTRQTVIQEASPPAPPMTPLASMGWGVVAYVIVRDASVGECRCNEMCGQAEADGECDDGGPGSDYDWCDLGDDCACDAVGRMPDACRFSACIPDE